MRTTTRTRLTTRVTGVLLAGVTGLALAACSSGGDDAAA